MPLNPPIRFASKLAWKRFLLLFLVAALTVFVNQVLNNGGVVTVAVLQQCWQAGVVAVVLALLPALSKYQKELEAEAKVNGKRLL